MTSSKLVSPVLSTHMTNGKRLKALKALPSLNSLSKDGQKTQRDSNSLRPNKCQAASETMHALVDH
jgi:hypothetical protein